MHIFQDKTDSNIARILIRKRKMFESWKMIEPVATI